MSQQVELIDKMKSPICKLKCIKYFFETQDPDYVRPIEYDEIQYGLSLLLDEISEELIEIRKCMEN